MLTLARSEPPNLPADLVSALGARYLSTQRTGLLEAARTFGPFDLIFEATGYSPLAFEAMEALGKNGVLVLSSVTGGGRRVEVPADAINRSFVLGNKVMVGTVNANRDHFKRGLRDLALAGALYPGWLPRLFTHRVPGLENYRQAVEALEATPRPLKVMVTVAQG